MAGNGDARSAAGEGMAPQAPASQAHPLPNPSPIKGEGLESTASVMQTNTRHEYDTIRLARS